MFIEETANTFSDIVKRDSLTELMSHDTLDAADLRHLLRRIRDQTNGPIEPEYIRSLSALDFATFTARFGSLAQACLEAGCDYRVSVPDPEVYAAGTEDAERRTALIDDLVRIVTDLDQPPTPQKLDAYGRYNYGLLIQEFGSWTAVVLEAGLDPNRIPGYLSPQAFIDDLRRLADRLGNAPSRRFVGEHGDIEIGAYDDRFLTWAVALQSAGLSADEVDPRREIIFELEYLAGQLGHQPNATEIETYTSLTPRQIRDEFTTVDDALASANVPAERDLTPTGSLTESPTGNAEIPSHTDLLREIFTIRRRHHKPLKTAEAQRNAFDARGVIDKRHYDAQFGSLTDAFEYAAGLDARKFRESRKDRIGDIPSDILAGHARELGEILDRQPLVDEVIALTDATLEQFLDTFDSWETIFDPVSDLDVASPTNAELLDDVKQAGTVLGHPPTPDDFREIGYYPVESVLRRFGSWPAMLREIGVEIDSGVPEPYLAEELTGHTIQRAETLCSERFDHRSVLVDDLYRISRDLGRAPSTDDIRTFGARPYDSYQTTFNDPTAVVTDVGGDTTSDVGLQSGTERSQLLDDLETVSERLDRRVWPRDIAFFARYTLPSYLAVFETLDSAFTAGGVDADHFPTVVADWSAAWNPQFKDASAFLDALREQYDQTGDSPTMAEMREAGTNPQRCYEHYDSWAEALDFAGVPSRRRPNRQTASRAELRTALQELTEELGHTPRTTDITKDSAYGLSTYYKHYASWQEALEDAGVSTKDRRSEATSSPTSETESDDIIGQIMTEFEDIATE